jgi:multifunctional beta-oxidation protein
MHRIQIVENFENKSESNSPASDDPTDGDIELVREAKRNLPEPQDYSYSERDVILYNLSIGATEQELHWTFENHEDFAPLPTFGVVPQFMTSSGVSLDFLPGFNPVRPPLAS